ncbi:hypothetical protein O1L60_21935 [Streptomyces diastatochromogenes]|nr:hypothetical protein [Streptomyces diastatochromogenes]
MTQATTPTSTIGPTRRSPAILIPIHSTSGITRKVLMSAVVNAWSAEYPGPAPSAVAA